MSTLQIETNYMLQMCIGNSCYLWSDLILSNGLIVISNSLLQLIYIN